VALYVLEVVCFLSCLCGSELQVDDIGNTWRFLSCLCGSEQEAALYLTPVPFLSCLCGSEHVVKHIDDLFSISELPMRQ